VQRCCIGRLYLQRACVVCHCLLVLAQPVMAERAVVVSAAVGRVEANGVCVVMDCRLETTLHKETSKMRRHVLAAKQLYIACCQDALKQQLCLSCRALLVSC
jgi:hypothetical protein